MGLPSFTEKMYDILFQARSHETFHFPEGLNNISSNVRLEEGQHSRQEKVLELHGIFAAVKQDDMLSSPIRTDDLTLQNLVHLRGLCT
ncbi:hypothetical protein EYZ11_012944 [Aspergillus tanneri]|uniref:Uncharacterized protein n=1 Tax=Aspergillus tanneri TaxID=1220188 RepID=A0A4S3J119_9EURO|nr:hypothetical protein EYZ11_012944 [Aspergillus tanneri]